MKFNALLACLALICGHALATPYTWTDTVNPADVKIGPGLNNDPYSVTFNITDGLNGYRPGVDNISGYTVSVNLYDDGGFADGGEKAQISVLNNILFFIPFFSTNTYTNLSGSEAAPFTSFANALLSDTGLLTIWIASDNNVFNGGHLFGDFMFGSATLTATGNRVPEPSSMLLLGAALMAVTLAARRRKQQ